MHPLNADAAVAAVLAGDQEAYRHLIVACETRARAMGAALLPERALIDDCAQEAFVAAYGRLAEIRPGGDVSAWLAGVMRHHALILRRGWLRQEGIKRGYRAELEGALDAELEARADAAHEAVAQLRAALGGLEEQAREAVEEHYWRGASLADIARARERSDAWARVVLFRAREALARAARGGRAPAAASGVDAERLDHLLSAWPGNGLTDAEGRELADLARREAAVRARLADLALVHRLLPEAAPPPPRRTADIVLGRLRATGAVARAETVTDQDRPAGVRASRLNASTRARRSAMPWLMAAAALALLVGGVLLWVSRPPATSPVVPVRNAPEAPSAPPPSP